MSAAGKSGGGDVIDRNDWGCECCGNDAGPWMALWEDERQVGVRLRPGRRSRAALDRAVQRAVIESGLCAHYRLAIVHRGECRMPLGEKRCTCGPDVFADREAEMRFGGRLTPVQ